MSLDAWSSTARKLGFRWVVAMGGGIFLLLFGAFWGLVGITIAISAEQDPDARAGMFCALGGGLLPFLAGSILVGYALRTRRDLARLRELAAFARACGPAELNRDGVSRAVSVSPLEAEHLILEAAAHGILVDDAPLASLVEGASAESPAPSTEATLAVGAVLRGTWRIEGLLGAGGMGYVYDVTHLRTGRRYALKTLIPDTRLAPEALRRFEREARAATALGHPGLVAVHDFDRVGSLDFIVMDRLDGEPLDARLRRVGSFDWRDAVVVGVQIADALGAAHEAGLLHRDLKPGNIFLARDAREARGERAVLLDFGLAKSTDDAATSRITATGAAVGTPLYMSPEQARGEPIDPRSDVYGLAATLYEMITGAPPFLEPTVARAYHRLLSEPALAASVLAPRPVPPVLDALLAAALAKDPGARPASAASFRDALGALLAESRAAG